MHSYPVLVMQDATSQMFVGHSYSTWFKYQIENKNESIIPTPESSHVLFFVYLFKYKQSVLPEKLFYSQGPPSCVNVSQSDGKVNQIQSKLTALEQKVSLLTAQLTALSKGVTPRQGKFHKFSYNMSLIHGS